MTRRNRLSTRGAVLVESLIVCSLSLVLLACIVYAHALYAAKIDSTGKARAEAWQRALPGCEGGLTQLAMGALSGGAFDALATADAFDIVETPAWMSDMGRGVSESPPVTVTASGLLGGYGATLTSRNAIACNEVGDDTTGGLLTNGTDLVRQLIPGI